MSCILLSGFEPFSTFAVNPTMQLAEELDGEVLNDGTIIRGCVLPVVRQRSSQMLLELVARYKPIAVMAFGQAARASISIERVAINIDDFSIEDNAGNRVVDKVIVPGAPPAYWSTLPIKRLQNRLQEKGIPASISNTAGTFVCNHLFFHLQHALADQNIPSGFIHIPLLPEQALSGRTPSLPKAVLLRAVKQMANEVVSWRKE